MRERRARDRARARPSGRDGNAVARLRCAMRRCARSTRVERQPQGVPAAAHHGRGRHANAPRSAHGRSSTRGGVSSLVAAVRGAGGRAGARGLVRRAARLELFEQPASKGVSRLDAAISGTDAIGRSPRSQAASRTASFSVVSTIIAPAAFASAAIRRTSRAREAMVIAELDARRRCPSPPTGCRP